MTFAGDFQYLNPRPSLSVAAVACTLTHQFREEEKIGRMT